MRIGILINARLGSSRLKKKPLLQINGYPVLHYLIKRIINEFDREIRSKNIEVIIASSDEPENREFEMFNSDGVSVFYGSNNNIPLRQLQAANFRSLNAVVSVDGDDILCSVKGMRHVYEFLVQGKSYVKTSGLPFGMNSFGYSVDFLRSSLEGYTNKILETGWGRIFNLNEMWEVKIPFFVEEHQFRFTLDYQLDFEFLKSVIECFGENIFTASDEEVINLVVRHGLQDINKSISDEYWENVSVQIGEERSTLNK
jgi:spore coat polysaccharide biosynthesis protein SpsF